MALCFVVAGSNGLIAAERVSGLHRNQRVCVCECDAYFSVFLFKKAFGTSRHLATASLSNAVFLVIHRSERFTTQEMEELSISADC